MTTRFAGHLLGPDTHASRPAASAVPEGTLYSCSTHLKIYQSDGVSTWIDYFSDTGGSAYTPGGTDVAVADGGTGASTAADARDNLGLEIGVDIPSNAQVAAAAAADYAPGGTDVAVADGGTGASTAAAARTNLGISAANTPFTPNGSIAATDVQAAIQEVRDEAAGGGAALTVEEVDGSPTDSAVTKIVFPNGTLGIASHVATYTPTAGGNNIVAVEQAAARIYAYNNFR